MSKEVKYMKRTILFLLISSSTLLCAVFDSVDNSPAKAVSFIGGLLFFLFLLLGYFMFYRFSQYRKQQKNNCSVKQKAKPGIIVFFSNPLAKKADIVMIISFVISISMLLIGHFNEALHGSFVFDFLSVLSSAVFIFTAQMHAIMNGVNYQYYLSLGKTKE